MPTNSTLLIMIFVPSMIAATQWDVAIGFLCLYHSGFDKYNKSNVIASSVSACYLLLRLLDQLRSVKTPKKIKIKNQRCGRFFVVRFFVVFFFNVTTTIISTYSAALSLKTLTHDCVSYISMHMQDIKYMSNKIKQVIKSK